MAYNLVVARYTENLDWLSNVPAEFNIYIYNKGPALDDFVVSHPSVKVIPRKNIGREAETFLYHIVENIGNEDDHTIFCQGNPFEHSPDFLMLLAGYKLWKPVQPLSLQWRADKGVPPPSVLQLDPGIKVNGGRVRLESFSLVTWEPLKFFDKGALDIGIFYRNTHKLKEGVNIAAHFLYQCGFYELASVAAEHLVGKFCYGGIFSVRNGMINRYSRETWSRMLEVSQTHDIHAWMLEKLWLHLFGEKFLVGYNNHQ